MESSAPTVVVNVGVLTGEPDRSNRSADSAPPDFVADPDTVLSVDALDVVKALRETADISTARVEITGPDSASIIAGQTMAIVAGVRNLVAADVKSARRVAVMMSRVLTAKAEAETAAAAREPSA